MKNTEFRIMLNFNPYAGSKEFFGAPSAASPLAHFWHYKDNKKVILGSPLKFKHGGTGSEGLGKKEYPDRVIKKFKNRGIVFKDGKVHIDKESGIILSDIGFLYQKGYDPLYPHIWDDITWRFKIDKITQWKYLSDKEVERYTLRSTYVGMKEWGFDKTDPHYNSPNEWIILASKLEALEKPITSRDKLKFFSRGGKDVPLFKKTPENRYTLTNQYSGLFLHLKEGSWDDFDSELKLKDEDELQTRIIINEKIKNTRIKESLIQEIFYLLANREGWYINREVPVRGKSRIDFLLKSKVDERWIVVETKLDDTPDAIDQLNDYVEIINKKVKKSRANTVYFGMLWDKKKKNVKPIHKVIVCKHPGEDTRQNAKAEGIDEVWTYRYEFQSRNKESCFNGGCDPLIGVIVENEEGEVILPSRNV